MYFHVKCKRRGDLEQTNVHSTCHNICIIHAYYNMLNISVKLCTYQYLCNSHCNIVKIFVNSIAYYYVYK